jgi:hypothetical protein
LFFQLYVEPTLFHHQMIGDDFFLHLAEKSLGAYTDRRCEFSSYLLFAYLDHSTHLYFNSVVYICILSSIGGNVTLLHKFVEKGRHVSNIILSNI